MIFGFLFVDLLLWVAFPFVILCLLWGDKKGWATFMALLLGGFAIANMGFGAFLTLFTDPVSLSTVLRNVALYAGVGFGFSFLKWWVLTTKSARQFREYLSKKSFTIDADKIASDVRRSRERGGVDHFAGSEDEAIEAAKTQKVQELRERAATEWNGSYDNTYRRVLSVIAKDPIGWETKYSKLTLTEYVTSWIVYWPMYAMLLVLDDLIRHIIDWFVEVFGKGFQKIANAAFGKID